jgi:Tol biopolymer transport system component
MIGKTLNHYKVISHLGGGGMGEVYVAEDTKLGRRVALKMLPAAVAGDSERRARFEREARVVAALNHPHIVTIYGVEESDGTHFLAMELVEGQVLTELIPQQGLRLSKLLDYGVAMADAVSTAHRKGIIHRDLKPDNVMLGADGRLKVLDFGLAKLREQEPGEMEQVTSLPTQSVTQDGKILGTVSYMAPEQAEGKPVDVRSDIFSLGVILYQMATGKRPFRGDTTISTITAILRDTPTSVTEVNQNLPRHLGRVIKRCLEKNPERRYQTAQDLRNELEVLKEEVTSGSLSVTEAATAVQAVKPRRMNWLVAGMAIVAVAAVAVAVGTLVRRDAAGPAATAPAPAMEISRLTSTGASREAAISADGRYVAYILDEQGRPGMWVTQVSTGSQVNILPAEEGVYVFDPVYSPDGEHIYFVRGELGDPISHLYRIPALGGEPRLVLEDTEGRASFSPDGSRFVFNRFDNSTRSEQIVVAGVDGGSERILAERQAPASFDDPVWSPDGTVIAAPLSTVTDRISSAVVIIPAEGGDETPLTDEAWLDIGEMSWLPDGSGLVVGASEDFATTGLYEVSYPRGQVRRITNDLNSYHGVSLTADGSTLATQLNESSFHIWTHSLDDDAAAPTQITRGREGFDGDRLSWTAEDRILYASSRGGVLGVYNIPAGGGDPTRLTPTDSLSGFPVVTPDGRHVVFMSNRAGPVNIWRMDLDGRNPQMLTNGVLDNGPSVSPDGRWVVYEAHPGERLMRVSIDGGTPELISEVRLGAPRVSPDGSRILGWRWHEERQRFMVDIIPFEGGEPLQSLEIPGSDVSWTPDGEGIAYQDTTHDVGNVWVQQLDGGDPVQLTFFEDMHIDTFTFSPDGQSLVLSRGESSRDIVLIKSFR